jgi:pyruvate,water dikinase
VFGSQKHYIINTSNIDDSIGVDVVGEQAVEASKLLQTGVLVPDSFVLTSVAFDDFLTSADLIDKITASLNKLNGPDPQMAKVVSDEISAMISSANFPSIILNPLTQAYRSMSGFTEKYLTLSPSWVMDSVLMPDNFDNARKTNVKTEPALLYSVKQIWSSLFSPEALLLRQQLNYAGGISIAVYIQRMIQSEISGSTYSVDPVTGAEGHVVVEAILGLPDLKQDPEIQPDIYKVDASDFKISEKNILPQTYMLLRKGRAGPDEDPTMKVAISSEWKRRQKLPDEHIVMLAKITDELAKQYGHDIELGWAYETGRLYITKVGKFTPVKVQDIDLTSKLETELGAKLTGDIEVIPATEVSEPPAVNTDKPKKIDIKSLVDEVQTLASSDQLTSPEMDSAIKAELADEPQMPTALDEVIHAEQNANEIHQEYELITNLYLDVSDMNSEKLSNASRFDGVYLDGTEMILRHHVLPESIARNATSLSRLIESYALEISTAAKVVEPKPLYYSFSDIGDAERRSILGEEDREKGLDGGERFVLAPEAMLAEIQAIKRARNTYDAKNIKLILPKLRSEAELVDLKKILNSQGVRRTSVMELLAEVATPAFLYELSKVKENDVDGLFINLPKLAHAMFGRPELIDRDKQTVVTALKLMQEHNKDKKFQLVLKSIDDLIMLEEVLQQLPISSIVFAQIPQDHTLKSLKYIDSSKLKNSSAKKGRKPKELI